MSDPREKEPMKRWKLLPEARRHRVLFFVILLAVLVFALTHIFGLLG
ncbi:MAG: hypothetical protein ACC661_10560 [Verrucomicrobiales bacterium]